MHALKSPLMCSIWYIIWLFLVVVSQRLEQFCIGAKGLHLIAVAFFLVYSLLIMWFMVIRYHHEQRYFIEVDQSLLHGITDFFGLLIFAVIAIGGFMVLVSYFKALGRFPALINRTDYLDRGPVVFWFDLLATTLIIAVEQQFVTVGFFFDYFLRQDSLGATILGIFFSGLIFGILNVEVPHLINFFIYAAIGWMIATIYLSTQNFRIAILLGMFVAVLKVVLI